MTEAEALRLLRAVLKAHDVRQVELTTPSVMLSTGDVELGFDFLDGALRCRAELHHFRRTPERARIERLSKPAIGALILDGDRIFLEKLYRRSLPITQLLHELEALTDESRAWICERLAEELTR